MHSDLFSKSLFQSLLEAPLLVGDLPEATTFCRKALRIPSDVPPLNFQQKLGHLCEDALAHLLDASPRFDLLARNLQIQKDIHSTVGELDFLLRDLESGQIIHLELATKFYLAVETESGLALPGPDARDNYFEKLRHLRTHQLRLSSDYRQHLPESFRHEDIVTQHLIHGCLFDHIHAPQPATPEWIHPTCRRGRWLTIDEIPSYFPPDTTFQIIPKFLWPVPLETLGKIPLETWLPDTPIDRCLMLRKSGETIPYFVAPPVYPNSESV